MAMQDQPIPLGKELRVRQGRGGTQRRRRTKVRQPMPVLQRDSRRRQDPPTSREEGAAAAAATAAILLSLWRRPRLQ